MDRSTLFPAALRLRVRPLFGRTHGRRRARHSTRLRPLLAKVIRAIIGLSAVSLIVVSIFLFNAYRSSARIVDERLAHGYLTSRAGIYAAPRTLRPGQKYSRDDLAAMLRRAGYIESESASEVWNGSFSLRNDALEIRPNNTDGYPALVRLVFTPAGRIARITGDEMDLDSMTLAAEPLTNNPASRGGAHAQLSFNELPPILVQAITSIEDRRFFDHHGLDPFGVLRARVRNAGDERFGQGGSTLTQQLVKNTYLTPERTLRRKFAEAMLAFTIERRMSKQDIFALYCNEIYLGQRGAVEVRGVAQAARIYFGKELKDLTLPEAATIAGMIQSPSRYSPAVSVEAARARRNTVLGTMVRDGYLTLDQAASAAVQPLSVVDFDSARESVAPYFIDYVNRLPGEPATGGPPVTHAQAGHATVTTLDLDLQQLAAAAIAHQLDKLDQTYKAQGLTPQAALVALDPKTGNVLAMIGGRDYATSQLNRATDAWRQPGSVFKPFVYAAALESGMSPLQTFRDAPQEFTYARTQKYRPANFGGGFSMRDVPMRNGLIKSLNVVTVDVAMQTGLARVANTAARFGLPRPTPYPALALGTKEATPLQIAAAYATFANGGRKIQPRVLANSTDTGEQIIAPTTAYIVTDMLEGVIDHGTARAARGAIANTAIAGKTGTSRDGWFVGYTPNLVCAIWVGFDDNNQLGLTGAEAALPIWTEFMRSAIDLRPELGGKSFEQPQGITIAEIDPETDELATGKCPAHERVAMLTEQAPTSECFRHNIYFDLRGDDPSATIATARPGTAPLRKRLKTLPAAGETVAIDRDGKKVLVNEMRVASR